MMMPEELENGNGDQEFFGAGGGGVPKRLEVITLEQYGKGERAQNSLETLFKQHARTQITEIGYQMLWGRGGECCYVPVWTWKPKDFRDFTNKWEVRDDGKTILLPANADGAVIPQESRLQPALVFNIIGQDGKTLTHEDLRTIEEAKKVAAKVQGAKIQPRQLTERLRMMVLTPELNKITPRQYMGPDGRYPNWMYREELRLVSRSYNRMKRAIVAECRRAKREKRKRDMLRVLRELTEKDLERKRKTGQDFVPYRVFYPAVGARFAPADDPAAPLIDKGGKWVWVDRDDQFHAAIRLKLLQKEVDPWYFFFKSDPETNEVVFNEEDGELRQISPVEQVRLRKQIAADYQRTESNFRFEAQEPWPEGLYFNPHENGGQYEVNICDLDIRGRTMLAHSRCYERMKLFVDPVSGEEFTGYAAEWKYFLETIRRKSWTDEAGRLRGFRIPTDKEIKELVKDSKKYKKFWSRYLKGQNSFVEQNYDRSYPNEQMKEATLLSDTYSVLSPD